MRRRELGRPDSACTPDDCLTAKVVRRLSGVRDELVISLENTSDSTLALDANVSIFDLTWEFAANVGGT